MARRKSRKRRCPYGVAKRGPRKGSCLLAKRKAKRWKSSRSGGMMWKLR